jgi:hypothetical protein
MSDRWNNSPSEESKDDTTNIYRRETGITHPIINNHIPPVENDEEEMGTLLPRGLLDDRIGALQLPDAQRVGALGRARIRQSRFSMDGNARPEVNQPLETGVARQLYNDRDGVDLLGRRIGGVADNTSLPIERLMSIDELRQRFTEVPVPINAETRLPDINRLIAGRKYIISNTQGSPQHHIIYRGPGPINRSRQQLICTVTWTSLPGNPLVWSNFIYIENGTLIFELPQDQRGGKLKQSRKNKKNMKNKKSRKSRKGIKSRKSRKSKK